ncbi:carbohydrate ABC transporter permease [Deinococcus frigens]|uniref:carbohydrate ABC transporter permease n=1 Tax=Deinococcus frigens TaxID=249403 RepID=UPI0009FC2635|nr:carbohydrate ABC transporter permease [Deinococcus frigens]
MTVNPVAVDVDPVKVDLGTPSSAVGIAGGHPLVTLRSRRRPRPFRWTLWAARILLLISAGLVLVPVVYQFGLSVKPSAGLFSAPLSPLTWPPTAEHYAQVLEGLPLWRYTLNSLVFALGVTVGQLLLAVPAAYALSHLRPRWGPAVFGAVLISLMVPFVVTYLPNYLLLARWGLLNTLPGLILPMLTAGYAIFLLRQHFLSFPREIIEAALVDGATTGQRLWRVLLPAHRAPVAALAVYLFISTWNQFVWPQLVAGRSESLTLTVAVQRFASGEGGNAWGPLMAAATLATLPTVLLYFFMRRALLDTFSEGAVKG